MTPSLIVLLVAVAAAGGIWLAWNVVRRSQRRQRAIRDLLDAADALEASLRSARVEIEAVARDHVNPVRGAMEDLLRQRMWLQEHGQSASLQQLADVRAGISICYDMWFPETTRSLVAMGAEVILHPTMTNTIDRDVEQSIARASAARAAKTEPSPKTGHSRNTTRRLGSEPISFCTVGSIRLQKEQL